MRAREAVRRIEAAIPPEWAEEWDNVGLLAGDPEAEVRAIRVSLDASEGAVRDAARVGAMLLTHHPLLFRPVRRVLGDEPVGRILTMALREGVPLMAAHTNWDVAPKGVNRCLADRLGLVGPVPLEPRERGWGLGARGEVPVPLPLDEWAGRIREAWGLSWLRVFGDRAREVRVLALVGGAGGDGWRAALEAGADLFVTADMGYHAIADAVASGLAVAVADHGEMERTSLDALAEVASGATGLEALALPRGTVGFVLSDGPAVG